MTTAGTLTFSIEDFLEAEQQKDMLRFSTAGSVDDGKSTLIGRLLYDTQSVYEDQVRAIEGKGTTAPGQIDFALLTDGLRAEREQGITIDVAYRYFSTPRRKFIIADTPGHEQYTRNMATGASTADAAIVLIDAGKGVLPQSRRHAFIASLLGVRHVIAAVNKMDLVAYSEERFREIEHEFRDVLHAITAETGNALDVMFVPVSALVGDNVVHHSEAMPWYEGKTLLALLETLPAGLAAEKRSFRFPVQRVVRPDHTFRGFSGQIAAGSVRPGDAIVVLPSRKPAIVERIVTWDGDLQDAAASLSVTLVLDREIDISRGDLIASANAPARVASSAGVALVWMDQRPLEVGRRYLVKHASHTVAAIAEALEYRSSIATLERESADTLVLNDIGRVRLRFLRTVAVDLYAESRLTGALIVIDPETNSTIAAGMIVDVDEAIEFGESDQLLMQGPVTAQERAARWGHRGAVLELTAPVLLIDALERSLFQVGAAVTRLDTESLPWHEQEGWTKRASAWLARSGQIVLVTRVHEGESIHAVLDGETIELEWSALASMQVIAAVHRALQQQQVFISHEREGI